MPDVERAAGEPASANFLVFPHGSVNIEDRQVHGNDIVAPTFETVDCSAIGSRIPDGGSEALDAIEAVCRAEYLHIGLTCRPGESDPQFLLNAPMEAVFEFVDEEDSLGCRGHRKGNVEQFRQADRHGSQGNPTLSCDS